MKAIRICSLVLACTAAFAIAPQSPLNADRKAALDRITADSLKGNLSFLASDAMEGRGTPSRGLNLAAEFIAGQFRRAGLEPAVDKSYFQTVPINARGSATAGEAYNVAGILRGSDPQLKETYVMVSAHYDHLGMNTNLEGDQIFNGANDDGSGTVSVIELAYALSTLKVRPKRSILFMAFCGEERGLVGSTFYGKNPLVPLVKTVAGINLEHMGRTDDVEGERKNEASMTGFDFSDMGPIFNDAGKPYGVKVTKHPQNSDSFFNRSDNAALARVGIPSHTLCTAFIFPDYHKVGDHWDKVDYANLEKVLKAVGLGILTIADSSKTPQWNEANPKTARYVEAAKALKGGGS